VDFWRKMLKSLVLLCGVIFSASAFAGTWSVDSRFRDPRTSEEIPAAVATNAGGYKVAIFRNKDRRVRIFFAVPLASFDRLPRSGRMAAFRPDENSAVFIESNSVSGLEQPFSVGDSVRSLLWHGQDYAPFSGTLRNIMDSSKLTVRFFTDTGTTLDTVFDLNGATPVIAKALDIPETLSSEVTQRAMAARALKADAATRCYAPSAKSVDSASCMDAVERCAQKDESTFDAVTYRACLAKIKWPAG
jgi:hypothetical protein